MLGAPFGGARVCASAGSLEDRREMGEASFSPTKGLQSHQYASIGTHLSPVALWLGGFKVTFLILFDILEVSSWAPSPVVNRLPAFAILATITESYVPQSSLACDRSSEYSLLKLDDLDGWIYLI